jgi:signal peptidase I
MKNPAVATTPSPAPKSQTKEPPRGFIPEWTVTIILLVFGTSLLIQTFVVPSGSMESTILIGDHLFVDKLAYSPAGSLSEHLLPYEDVRRGDVIVFRWPIDIRQNYVKRVIGVPGDRIRLENKQLYLNGQRMTERYTQHIADSIEPYRDNFPAQPLGMVFGCPDCGPRAQSMLDRYLANGEVVVPPGNYFAMGDNRDNSLDSRYWGLVPRENIIGKPLIVYWSFDSPNGQMNSPWDIFKFFSRTRWDRMFRLIRPQPVQ